MDASLSATMLQSSEIDTVMGGNEHSHGNNGSLQNGFMDPRVLNQPDELDPDSTEPVSRDESQASSEVTKTTLSRKYAFLPTGCCYDPRMKLHANADFSASPHHPEDPRRIEAIMKEFRDAGLIYSGSTRELSEIIPNSPSRWMWRISARRATEPEVCLAHTATHYEWARALSTKTSSELRQLTNDFDNGRKSLYVGNLTFEAALISAGGAIETCKHVVAGLVKNAIAVIRPPGHHAEHNESLGFCIFNNVPIAAKVCMADYPETCRKILILDWDVHHGNGIQNMFYEDPNVLYISLHVYANGEFYPGQPDDPGLPDGGLENCGAGVGVGKNINIGWPEQGVGDAEYIAAFEKIVMPIAREFDPDLVIVSAGFDAAAGDELGGCWVTPACYSHMTHMLMSLANGKVAVCLEGGYNLRAISRSALSVAKTLMGEPPERMTLPPINKEASLTLSNVKRIQAAYWECMRPGVVSMPEGSNRGADRVSDLIRKAHKTLLAEKYNMIPLYIQRNKLSESFENQVLATPEIYKDKRILVILHDPPELLAQPDPYDGTVYGHNAFVQTEGVFQFIDWAIQAGFGVVDINMPQHISQPTDNDSYVPKHTESVLQEQAKELLCYLWDNYLEINPASSITFMGVGDAYLGIKMILTSRNAKSRIPSVVSFVSGSLRPVRSETDSTLSQWYKTNSRIYVSPDHACWSDEESARKVRKSRFGAVIKADFGTKGKDGGAGGDVSKMLNLYAQDAMSYMLVKVTTYEHEHSVDGRDPDETEDEVEMEDELAGPGGIQSIRVPVV